MKKDVIRMTDKAWSGNMWSRIRAILTGHETSIDALHDSLDAKTTWKTFLSESNVSVGNTYASTGKHFTLTKFALVLVGMSYGSGRPLALGIKGSESAASGSVALVSVVGSDISDTSGLTVTALLPAGTYYVWARTASATGSTSLAVQGIELGA